MSKAVQIFILLLFAIKQHNCSIRFNRINCTSLDKNFAEFDVCQLKVIQRNVIAISFNLKLLQIPVTNCRIHAQLFYKSSRYLPFLFNGTLDACDFMRNQQRYKFPAIIYNLFESTSNMNHTCPYDHDIYVRNFVMSELPLPFPSGEFLFKSIWFVDKEMRLTLDVGFVHQEVLQRAPVEH